MILRWIYNFWIFIWKTIGILLLIVILMVGIVMAGLQLPQSKSYIKNHLETAFNKQFEGSIEAESLEGLLPFRFQLDEVGFYTAGNRHDPVMEVEQVYVSLNLWELIQGYINISALELYHPSAVLQYDDSTISLASVFENREHAEAEEPGFTGNFFNRYSIYAPNIHVVNGSVHLDESISVPSYLRFTTPADFTNLNADFFVETIENQYFFDIASFSAATPDQDFEFIDLSGQLFNDGDFLEFNGINFQSGNATFQFSAEASPVNIFGQNVGQQLLNASYQLDIQRLFVRPEVFERVNSDLSQFQYPLEFEGYAEGTMDTLWVDDIQVSTGESYILTDGQFLNLNSPGFAYDFQINNFVLTENDANELLRIAGIEHTGISSYGNTVIQGGINGTRQNIYTDLFVQTDRGEVSIDAELADWNEPQYEFHLELDSLDITPVLNDTLQQTVLNGLISGSGRGVDASASFQASMNLANSTIYNHSVQQLISEINYSDQSTQYSLRFQQGDTEGSAGGSYAQRGDQHIFSIDANVRDLDITKYLSDLPYNHTNFSGSLVSNFEGTSLNDTFGKLSIELDESVIDEDTLRPHQLYVDLIEESETNTRTLRFTSSFVDGELSGSVYPDRIQNVVTYWYQYLDEQLKNELLTDSTETETAETTTVPSALESDTPFNLSLRISARDLELLGYYLPNMPALESNATLNASMTATADDLSLTATMFDNHFIYQNSDFNDLGLSFTGSFKYGEPIKSNSLADLQINSPSFTLFDQYDVTGTAVNASLRDSIITFTQQVENAFENLTFESKSTTIWYNNRFETVIDSMVAGSPDYTWHVRHNPLITYNSSGQLRFDQFIVESEDDFFQLDGTFSESYDDSVNYSVQNFSLERVSELIGGRIHFSGVLNGDFTTRSLTDAPSIQGDLSITNGRVNNRIIGDVTLESRYNSDENRFDTNIHVHTDSVKYADYLDENNGIGNDLVLNGYFKAPEDADDGEDLFYFDADLREIDMWIVTFIVPNVINEMEGSSSGTGFIRGNRDDYNFDAQFNIEDVYGLPVFTNVPYTLNGSLDFNRSDGLLFNDIIVADGFGGQGILSGSIDLDDFSPITFFNLNLDLDDLRFMNNQQDPNVPFYANLYGSGAISLTGTNENPLIRTIIPIELSTRSNIVIPLQEETELEQDRRFIQFVESFDEMRPLRRRNGQNGNGTDENGESEVDLTFLDLFNMDLQFIANNPVSVQLIFDPVTNEILNASGTGQIRLLLEDQDVSMFGRFNIQDGDYQFVGGDIFTRRFNLQEGGTISWQGDLAEANLNVTASYRARPDISTLMPTGNNFQRIPVELILQIGGTMSQIENEFYFQIPTGIEGTQDPTITAQINRLNQNEDEKVLQAFGLLLTGNFIPSDELQTPEFRGISGTNALVSPLVSSQIINPLLSNQINSLLRSDITFDIDLNLTAFNEVDLGVALRLFNDRVVLRREGQITGEQSDIGDLGATYRINRIFSLTAFHRQDPTLSNRTDTETRQTQEMNGMGVEAQFQFNTWQRLKKRITNSVRRLFGLKGDEPAEEDEEQDSGALVEH